MGTGAVKGLYKHKSCRIIKPILADYKGLNNADIWLSDTESEACV